MPSINIFRNSTEYTTVKKGKLIFKEGEPGNIAYAIKEGEVDIVLGERVIDHVLPGGIIGEMALIDKRPRSASAVAATDCQLVPINDKQFTFLVQQTPYFALDVMRVMADRLRRLMDTKTN
jgi:CRP/FNR family cyclic AMP-dependent transcriptional regulator